MRERRLAVRQIDARRIPDEGAAEALKATSRVLVHLEMPGARVRRRPAAVGDARPRARIMTVASLARALARRVALGRRQDFAPD